MGCSNVTPKREFCVAILGLEDGGKTTLLYHIKDGERVDTVATVGFNTETIVHKGSRITMWDVGGSDKSRRLWRRAVGPSVIHGVIFVVDSNDTAHFKDAKDLLRREIDTDLLRDSVVLVLGNKHDLTTSVSIEKLETDLSLKELTQPWTLMPCSAASGYGLDAAMNWLVESMYKIPAKA